MVGHYQAVISEKIIVSQSPAYTKYKILDKYKLAKHKKESCIYILLLVEKNTSHWLVNYRTIRK